MKPTHQRAEIFASTQKIKPIKEKFRMIRADCLGSRQDCEVCAPPAVISYYQQYANLLKQKEL